MAYFQQPERLGWARAGPGTGGRAQPGTSAARNDDTAPAGRLALALCARQT